MGFFPTNIDLLGRALQASSLRGQVLANNIANSDTPGYQAQTVQFEDLLQQQLQAADGSTPMSGLRADSRHFVIGPRELSDIQPAAVSDTTGAMRPDGNNVDVEGQMAQLSANQLWYQALVRMESDSFTRLAIAIKGGV